MGGVAHKLRFTVTEQALAYVNLDDYATSRRRSRGGFIDARPLERTLRRRAPARRRYARAIRTAENGA